MRNVSRYNQVFCLHTILENFRLLKKFKRLVVYFIVSGYLKVNFLNESGF